MSEEKNQTILVTGVSGFVGHHLARALKANGVTVFGTGMAPTLDPELMSYVDEYFGNCDLTKPEDVSELPLNKVTGVINLAGLAQVGGSFDQEELYMKTNVAVHTVLAQELLDQGLTSVRVIAISSGAVYDNTSPLPFSETSKLVTSGSPYGRSKVAMEKALEEYRTKGLDIIIARPFNHIGPGQNPGFIIPDLIQQLTTQDAITVGNLQTKRDYTDVRDVVKAYILLATNTDLNHHVYNVCSGVSQSGETLLAMLQKGLGKENVSVEVDTARFRPGDPMDIIGDNARLVQDTGWQPQISLETTVADIVSSL